MVSGINYKFDVAIKGTDFFLCLKILFKLSKIGKHWCHEEGASTKRVTHTGLCLSTRPGLLGKTYPLSHQRHRQVTHSGLEEWKSERAPSKRWQIAKLQGWVVGDLSSYSPEGLEVPLISVSRSSPYPSVQTCSLGPSGTFPKVFPLHPITSVLPQHLTQLSWLT